jgi:hypothetical protein
MPTPVVKSAHAPWLCRSTRVRTHAKEAYTPSMIGSKYSYAVTQLETQGVLNPDAHMFVQEDFYQDEPDVVAAIITPLTQGRYEGMGLPILHSCKIQDETVTS